MKKVIAGIREVHKSLGVEKDFNKPDAELTSYDVAHHAGLSLDEEYIILEFLDELHRQEFLKRHLAKVIPVMEEMDILKGKIKLNGHFRNLSASGFEL